MKTVIEMNWEGNPGYTYYLCNEPLNPKGLKYPDDVVLFMRSQRLSRKDAASILQVSEEDLP